MISARNLCSATRKSRFITLNRVAEHIKGNNSKNIIILPPASSNIDQDRNTENNPGNFDNNDAIFEPAGKLEVDDFVNSNSETEKEEDRLTSSKLKKFLTPKWNKDSNFRREIPF